MAERTNSIHVGVEGQFVLDIKLSSNPKVQVSTFHDFTMIEQAGNLLPTFELAFSASPELEKEWVETLKIPMLLAVSMNSPEKIATNLQIITPSVHEEREGIKSYTAAGAFYAPAFTQTPYITTAKKSSGTEVLKQVAKKHFQNVDTDRMTDSGEQQIWPQPHITDKLFMDYVSARCYIKDSFIGTAILSDGTYRIVDVVKLSNSDADWEVFGDKEKALQPLKMPAAASKTGFMNHKQCYGMDTPIYCQDSGVRTVHRPNIKFGFVENKHAEVPEIQRRTLAPVVSSMSSDPKSIMAKANFDYGHALVSMESIQVTVASHFFPVKVWDVVKLNEPDSNMSGLNINHSGKYIVSRVSRTVKYNALYTTLLLNRDAHNEMPTSDDS